MTEAEWLECTNALLMLDHLRRQHASQRKLRLFGCARCRYFWHLFDVDDRAAVEVSEKYADGEAMATELRAASAAVWSAEGVRSQTPTWRVAAGAASEADPTGEGCWDTAWDFYDGADPAEADALDAAGEAEVPLVRDIFGNPFCPVAVDPAWLTAIVVALAQGIYADRAFDRLPILADALENVGCHDEQILAHCRGPGPHVRGCWVVDLLLANR